MAVGAGGGRGARERLRDTIALDIATAQIQGRGEAYAKCLRSVIIVQWRGCLEGSLLALVSIDVTE